MVGPFLVIGLVSPGAWEPRYSLPLVFAGAVALALLLDSVSGPATEWVQWRRFVPATAAGLVAVAAIALTVRADWQMLGRKQSISWGQPAGGRNLVRLARAPAPERENIGGWAGYNELESRLGGPGGIAFFSDLPPAFPAPLAGYVPRRSIVAIGPCPQECRAELTTEEMLSAARARRQISAIAASLRSHDVRYLYAPRTSLPQHDLDFVTGAGFEKVAEVYEGSVYRLTGA